jgi:hypothetical protein
MPEVQVVPSSPNFDINPKQAHFLEVVLDAVAGKNDYRYIAYGGAFRSGKSYGSLSILYLLCAIYPGSRWIVVTDTHGFAQENTWPELLKIIDGRPSWNLNFSRLIATYHNGSSIEFRSEDHQGHPDQSNFDGLSCSGIMMEECQRLSHQMFLKAMQRTGSLRLEKEPKPLILCTFNPSQNWTKRVFFEPWRRGELQAPYYFINALPSDNPTNTKEQIDGWSNMDARSYRQYVEGDWTNFVDTNNLFAYAFDRERHLVQECIGAEWAGDNDQYLWLSCDQNKNPLVTMVFQHYGGVMRVLDIIRIQNGDVYKMCHEIRRRWPNFAYKVTGDASGYSGNAAVSDGLNYYRIMQAELQIPEDNFEVGRKNPDLIDNGRLVNAALEKYPIMINAERCEPLIYDFENVRVTADMKILKKDRSDEAQQSDALDCFRYAVNCELRALVI